MPDSPITAKFLTHAEKKIAVERLKSNQTGIENKHLKVRDGLMANGEYTDLCQ